MADFLRSVSIPGLLYSMTSLWTTFTDFKCGLCLHLKILLNDDSFFWWFLDSRLRVDRHHWRIFRCILELSQREDHPLQDDLHPGDNYINTFLFYSVHIQIIPFRKETRHKWNHICIWKIINLCKKECQLNLKTLIFLSEQVPEMVRGRVLRHRSLFDGLHDDDPRKRLQASWYRR